MLDEMRIIHDLQSIFPDHIGDDAAVIPFSDHQSYVITKDLLVEDTHFRLSYVDPVSLAYKSLQVNLSDIAAMGARPQHVLLGLSLPVSFEDKLDPFLKGFTQACKESSVTLIGGDTTKSSRDVFISITAIGIVESKNLKYRHTAQIGDLICVAGPLGHAHVGLTAFEASYEGLGPFKEAFLKPKARVEEGLWFSHQPAVHSMMDISDGLFIDLKKLCAASQLGAEIDLDKLPLSPEFKKACGALKLDPQTTTLTGGEDYGLLFSIAPESFSDIKDQFERHFGYDLTCVGKMMGGSDVRLVQNGIYKNLSLNVFTHFGGCS